MRKIASRCMGGPYSGEVIEVRIARGDRTMLFTAKGMTGYYILESKTIKPKLLWVPLERPTNGIGF